MELWIDLAELTSPFQNCDGSTDFIVNLVDRKSLSSEAELAHSVNSILKSSLTLILTFWRDAQKSFALYNAVEYENSNNEAPTSELQIYGTNESHHQRKKHTRAS